MRALITGASGFVGTWLAQHLLQCGDEVIATVHDLRWKDKSDKRTLLLEQLRSYTDYQADAAKLRVCDLDITDPQACAHVIGTENPEVVYHLAGMAFVPDSETDFSSSLQINVAGTHNILRVCHLLQREMRCLLVSSAEVFGRAQPHTLPFDEQSALEPVNAYSLSKLMAEMVGARFARLGSVHVTVVRPFNHIGAGQDARFVTASFASQLAAIAVGKAPPIMRVGNLEAQRDFSDVRDIVRAYRLAALKGSDLYVLSSGRAVAVQTILDQLIAASKLSVDVQHDPARMRPAEVPVVYGSSAKARGELDWQPQFALEETLRDIYRYWLQRQSAA